MPPHFIKNLLAEKSVAKLIPFLLLSKYLSALFSFSHPVSNDG
jgi:hypothetical protein